MAGRTREEMDGQLFLGECKAAVAKHEAKEMENEGEGEAPLPREEADGGGGGER